MFRSHCYRETDFQKRGQNVWFWVFSNTLCLTWINGPLLMLPLHKVGTPHHHPSVHAQTPLPCYYENIMILIHTPTVSSTPTTLYHHCRLLFLNQHIHLKEIQTMLAN